MAASTLPAKRSELSPRIVELTSLQYRDPVALAKCMTELQQVAHVISPAAAFAALPPNVTVTPVPVVIDPTFDPKTGRGTDVYHQPSLHKSENIGTYQDPKWVPLEVSLNANAIMRVLQSAGVSVTKSERTDDGSDPHYCAWTTHGRVRQFDGGWLDLPPGDVEIDLRDGSEQIGGWNADDWPAIEADAKARKAKAEAGREKDAWKIKGEIGGWSADRVVSQRRFILPMAQTKSGNRLGRKLGLKQIYTIAELTEKPFVIFRASWQHDMTNPAVVQMVTLAELGSLNLLFPPAMSAPALPPAVNEPPTAESPANESTATTATRTTTTSTAAPPAAAVPEGAQEIDDIPEFAKAPEIPADVFTITKVSMLGERYFFETVEGKTFTTEDRELAKRLNEARKAKQRMVIDGEKVDVGGSPFLNIVEAKPFTPADTKKY